MSRIPKPKPARPDTKTGFGTGTQKENAPLAGAKGLITTHKRMGITTGVYCPECPFRRDSIPGYLGGYTPEMYLEITHSPGSIACHMSPGFQERDIEKQRHCTGVSAYRANVGHTCKVELPNGEVLVSAAEQSTEFVKTNGFTDLSLAFGSPSEFILHHSKGQRR